MHGTLHQHNELKTQLEPISSGLFWKDLRNGAAVFNNSDDKKVLFADGLCHIMGVSIVHCIKTKNYSTKNEKNIKIDEVKNVTLSELIEI